MVSTNKVNGTWEMIFWFILWPQSACILVYTCAPPYIPKEDSLLEVCVLMWGAGHGTDSRDLPWQLDVNTNKLQVQLSYYRNYKKERHIWGYGPEKQCQSWPWGVAASLLRVWPAEWRWREPKASASKCLGNGRCSRVELIFYHVVSELLVGAHRGFLVTLPSRTA